MSLFKYQKFDIEVINNNGNALLEVYTLGQALGHTRWNGEKTCQNPKIGAIDALLERAEINPFLLEGGKYITLDGAEKLITVSRSQEKDSFKKWFDRNKGKLIKSSKLQIIANSSQKHFKYTTALKRRKIILNTNITELDKEIKAIMLFNNKKSTEEKIQTMQQIQKTILERKDFKDNIMIALYLMGIIENIEKKIQRI
ncbi:MAG: hypothetical protein ACRCTZ_01975 [Sarcina sp.]